MKRSNAHTETMNLMLIETIVVQPEARYLNAR